MICMPGTWTRSSLERRRAEGEDDRDVELWNASVGYWFSALRDAPGKMTV